MKTVNCKRELERGGEIGIFTPAEAKALLSGISDDLQPASFSVTRMIVELVDNV